MENAINEVQEKPETAGELLRKVRKYTRRKYGAEDKIRIVLEGMKRDISVADLCRREKIHVYIYYRWMRDFLEAGKSRLKGDTLRQANEDEVDRLQTENKRLKEMVADQLLVNDILKKSLTGLEEGGTGR